MKRFRYYLMIMGAILLSIIICVTPSFGDADGQSEESFLFKDKLLQNALIKELDIKGIKYRIDRSGEIYYPVEMRVLFDSAVQNVINNKILNEFSISFTIDSYASNLIEELKRNKIPHKVEKISDKTIVTWDKGVDQTVRNIVKDQRNRRINKKISEESKIRGHP